MEKQYLKLDGRIKRWNRWIPSIFLMDTNKPSIPTAICEEMSYRSLDNRRAFGPRPLKAHAYNLGHVEDIDGEILNESRARNSEEAEEFAGRVLEAAREIPKADYLQEMDKVIWPERDEAGEREATVEAPHAEEEQPASYYSEERALLPEEIIQRAAKLERVSSPSRAALSRKDLVKDLVELLDSMDEEDLVSLVRFARLLTEWETSL